MIFPNITQRLKFSMAFMNMPPTELSLPRRVLMALYESGSLDGSSYSPEAMESDARRVLDEVLSLQSHERQALIATYSHHWESRRLACDGLRDYFRPLLARVIDDRHLLGKLVTRHYIAERDRGTGWRLVDLANEFGIGTDALKRAADLLDTHARALERAALQSLEARLQLLEPEAAHG